MTDAKKISQQMIDLSKTGVDNSFNAMMMVQDQMERLTNLYWGQVLNLPQEVQKGLNEWIKIHHKNCADFKKVLDDGLKNLESLYA
jgi:hypothetical protein